jgi:ATP-dependent Clp protease ATP-binding subunit ClpB
MEAFNVSRLIGSPPGYIGNDEGGQLTEAVRRNPYSIVLFDEIEKAHPDVFNILLQILDDGRVTDSHGRVVDFKNTIIIMTSNIGSEYILENKGHELVLEMLKKTFRPEFINRIDEIIIFNALTKNVISDIIKKLIKELEGRLHEYDLSISLTDKAIDYIIDSSYDINYGVRPLKRFISRNIETLLAKELIEEKIKYGDDITINLGNNELVIEKN